ncbi:MULTISPECIES: ABC transporter ATP-binding protein [Clostridium]|uniref:ABC transporter ATP-binding protein n=1 Tax=Clostridium cibarium TaxID=2762247 RepID=A0ABR8PVM1_9CLOT|nr:MULTISPECIES: ABC transporter ATP-binding protein [Clostridium]MBD7912213.1 ABC transporter ATP-binding protein [Clostridium cibarium]
MNLLSINHISMSYHSLKGETKALKDITFQVEDGEFLSILGPSGCGKSTLLNILCGILEPSKGEILFKGNDIHKNLNKIGYMFQKDHLFEWDTVWDNVTLGLRIKNSMTNENKDRVEHLLNEYGLIKFKTHYPKELSGGMRQRVALIRTLALNPEVLFLDEPFSALDFQTRLNVCDDVHSIIKKEKKTAIMVTHDISEAISLSNRIIVLTKRPASIKSDTTITFANNDKTPLERRSEKEFKIYFDTLWKELDSR